MKWFAYILILIALIFTATVQLFVSPWLKEKIESSISENCATCSLKIGHLSLSTISPGDISIENVVLHTGEAGATEVNANINWITFHVSIREAWNHRVQIRGLSVVGFDITIIDGDKKTAPASLKNREEIAPFHIGASQFSEGEFKYIRNHEGTSATVHVHQIEGSLSSIDPHSDAVIEGKLSARYENTGHAELKVETNPFKKPLQAKVDLRVKDQDLHDLSLFFEPNANVVLEGKIIDGMGVVLLNGDELKATDSIVYENLSAKVKKDKDRNGIETFFTNLGMGLSMQMKNTELQASDQTKSVDLKREADESIISFILRGLKEASMKIASRSNR